MCASFSFSYSHRIKTPSSLHQKHQDSFTTSTRFPFSLLACSPPIHLHMITYPMKYFPLFSFPCTTHQHPYMHACTHTHTRKLYSFHIDISSVTTITAFKQKAHCIQLRLITQGNTLHLPTHTRNFCTAFITLVSQHTNDSFRSNLRLPKLSVCQSHSPLFSIIPLSSNHFKEFVKILDSMGSLVSSVLPHAPNTYLFLSYVTYSWHMRERDRCWGSMAEESGGKDPQKLMPDWTLLKWLDYHNYLCFSLQYHVNAAKQWATMFT